MAGKTGKTGRKLVKGWYFTSGGDGGRLISGKTYDEAKGRLTGFHLSEWNLVGQDRVATEADLIEALGCDGVIVPEAIEG